MTIISKNQYCLMVTINCIKIVPKDDLKKSKLYVTSLISQLLNDGV